MPIRILIVEDQRIVREGLEALGLGVPQPFSTRV